MEGQGGVVEGEVDCWFELGVSGEHQLSFGGVEFDSPFVGPGFYSCDACLEFLAASGIDLE